MSNSIAYPYTKVAFMDTNALHYVRLCLSYAKEHSIFPFEDVTNGWQQLTDSLESITPKRRRENMQTGVKILRFLTGRRVQIEFSPMSEIELAAGLIRGKALLHAARDGAPHRMFTGISAIEIATTVSSDDMEDAGSAIDELPALLDSLDVTVTPTDPRERSDTLRVAAQLIRLRYMEPADVVIYSEAVLVQADYIVTSDRYLRSTSNQLRNSSDEPFQSVRTEITSIVANIIGCTADKVILPAAWHTRMSL